MKRISIEEWILRELWEAYPEGAAKNQLASREMAEFIRRWDTAALRDAGCSCRRPLLGFRPNVGPRCRLCNTVASEDKEKRAQ